MKLLFDGWRSMELKTQRLFDLWDCSTVSIFVLWGGIPAKENTEIWDEIRFVQKVKDTKMLCVAITRIDAETDEHDFKKAYNEAKAMPEGDERNRCT